MEFLLKHPAFFAPVALLGLCGVWVVLRRRHERAQRADARLHKAQAWESASPQPALTFEQLRDKIHREAVARCRQRLGVIPIGSPERDAMATDVTRVVEHLVDCENPLLNRIEHHALVREVVALLGFGPKPETPAAPHEGGVVLKVPHRSPE